MAKFSVATIADKVPAQHRGTTALLFVILGSLGIQTSTAVVSTLFTEFSPISIAGLRMASAAVILLLLVRPRPSRLLRSDWPQVVLYGVVVTLMTIGYFGAVKYIPLGIAVTIEFLGAFGVSLLGVRRWRDGLLSIGALVGVILIAGPTFENSHAIGYLFGALSALCMGGYTLLSARMGHGSPAVEGLKGLTLSITISALLLAPFSVPAIPHLHTDAWIRVLLAGAFGVALAYSADGIAGRLTSAAVIGVLFSLDPVIGALIGTVLLGEVLPLPAYLGILLIAVSGAVLVWQTNRSGLKIPVHTAVLDAIVSTKTGQLPAIKPQQRRPHHPKSEENQKK
ncbi:EamA family transporter [Rothia aerolata]|uniref:Membrane protein n=1 Tax=Rothia aerolata TaxID=1812262 RepID=A0A917IQR4_9MICC|nr:EamA family transporter [Rothia aerolata]GGH60991.1 membrane protein [Rothia aerolata]